MAGDPISTVIGVFPDYERTDKAIDDLRRNRFSYDHIRVVQQGRGSVFDNLKGMFTGQASVTSNTAEDLVKMGMPDYEAKHYQQELEAHHILLLMNADDRPEEAFSILRQNGAFDIDARLRTAPSDAPTDQTRPDREQEPVRPDREREPAPVNRQSTTRSETPPPESQSEEPVETSSPNRPFSVSNPDTTAETSRNP